MLSVSQGGEFTVTYTSVNLQRKPDRDHEKFDHGLQRPFLESARTAEKGERHRTLETSVPLQRLEVLVENGDDPPQGHDDEERAR